ncbi:DUF1365 domain-containing protein [Thorsellia kenyensis]|uniref:DUF1365 domain-containing protein n=1 Tax=Thorsellia kenyensis TaxID=1549888 RepID=A0ABV6CET3_9GAMM
MLNTDTLITDAKVLNAEVMHKRFLPKVNAFKYHVYYLSLPLELIDNASKRTELPIGQHHYNRHSFNPKDHGYRDERSLKQWAHDLLAKYECPLYEDITLICMPRIFGYVFNPVSFWVCKDENKNIKTIICEVNNTFGQTHTYVCLPPITSQSKHDKNQGNIEPCIWINADKCFHVSPFLPREGKYLFRFDITDDLLYINIDYYDKDNNKMLVTSLKGNFSSLTKKNLNKAFWRSPLVTLKAITLIHYQAIKLLFKKITFHKLPEQSKHKDSKSYD